jgi:predicted DNA binding CopG/RHH family protein
MPITKRPTVSTPDAVSEKAIADFIQGAPDSRMQLAPTQTAKPAQATEAAEQITIRIPKGLLDRATRMAERQGIPRASYIKRALALQLEEDEK